MSFCSGLLVLETDRPRNGAGQMAADEFLLQQTAHTPRPVLRFFSWSDRRQATCGYAIPAARAASMHPEWQWTRRRTGGGLVFHDSDCTLSLILPRTGPLTNLSSACLYGLLHQKVAETLRAAGLLPVLLQPTPRQGSPGDLPLVASACFTAPVPHDVLHPTGEKIAGGALRRTRTAFLYQGSLRLEPALDVRFRQLLPGLLDPQWQAHPGFSQADELEILRLQRKFWPDSPVESPNLPSADFYS